MEKDSRSLCQKQCSWWNKLDPSVSYLEDKRWYWSNRRWWSNREQCKTFRHPHCISLKINIQGWNFRRGSGENQKRSSLNTNEWILRIIRFWSVFKTKSNYVTESLCVSTVLCSLAIHAAMHGSQFESSLNIFPKLKQNCLHFIGCACPIYFFGSYLNIPVPVAT